MPSNGKGQSDVVEKIIFDTAYDAVIMLSVFDKDTLPTSSSTGFIVDVVQNRIIVLTCAHNILIDSATINSAVYPTMSATVTGAYQSGSCIRNDQPIAVSLRLLGMNVAADIAVLYSILPSEETPDSSIGYRFGKPTQRLEWADRSVLYGETVYTIGNMYGSNLSMIAGNCADDNLIYRPEFPDYMNLIPHIITTLAVKGGVSGGPILCYDTEMKRAVICGIVQWSKRDNNYTAGLNTKSLQKNYRKIYDLNIGCHTIKPNRLNFNGSTGKGYSGVATYQHVSGEVLTILNQRYPDFKGSQYRNQVSGILITSFSTIALVIPNSRVENAQNIGRCDYLKKNTRAVAISEDRIKVGDILMEIDGQRLGDEGQDLRLSDVNQYDAGKTRFIKCLTPSTARVRYYRYTVDRSPAVLEYVSADPSIELIADQPVWSIAKYGSGWGSLVQYKLNFLNIPSITRHTIGSMGTYFTAPYNNSIVLYRYKDDDKTIYFDYYNLTILQSYHLQYNVTTDYQIVTAILNDIQKDWTINVRLITVDVPQKVLISYKPNLSISPVQLGITTYYRAVFNNAIYLYSYDQFTYYTEEGLLILSESQDAQATGLLLYLKPLVRP